MKMRPPFHISSNGLLKKEPMDILFSSDPTGGYPPDQREDHGKRKPPEQITAPKFSKIFLKKGKDEKNREREIGEGALG
jgi:hypothetical protein